MKFDLLLTSHYSYTAENYLAQKMKKALQQIGGRCSEVVLRGETLLSYIKEEPPDWTLSFGSYHPHEPLYEITKVPHFAWQTKDFAAVMHYLKSPYGVVGFVDRHHERIFHDFNLKNFFFLPHAADRELCETREKKIFDIVLFDDLKCVNELEETWNEFFDAKVTTKLETIIKFASGSPHLTALESVFYLASDMGEKIPLLVFCVEEYFKAKKIRSLIETFQEKPLHIFGEHGGNNWYKRLKNAPYVSLHSALPYVEYFDVLKKSKILVREQMHFDCSDEWIFSALLAGCLVITNKTPYLETAFVGKLPFFSLEEKSQAASYYLEHENERESLLEGLRGHILKHHTFDVRAKELMEQLNAYRFSHC